MPKQKYRLCSHSPRFFSGFSTTQQFSCTIHMLHSTRRNYYAVTLLGCVISRVSVSIVMMRCVGCQWPGPIHAVNNATQA